MTSESELSHRRSLGLESTSAKDVFAKDLGWAGERSESRSEDPNGNVRCGIVLQIVLWHKRR